MAGTSDALAGPAGADAGVEAKDATEAGDQAAEPALEAPPPRARPRASAEAVADAQGEIDTGVAAERATIAARFASQRAEVEATTVGQEALAQATGAGSYARFLADVDQREQTGHAAFAGTRASLTVIATSQRALALVDAAQTVQRLRDDAVRQRQAVQQGASDQGQRMIDSGRAAGRRIVSSARSTITVVKTQAEGAVTTAEQIEDTGDREAVQRALRKVKNSTKDRLLDQCLDDHDRLVAVGTKNRDTLVAAAAKSTGGHSKEADELEAMILGTGARLAERCDAMLQTRLAAVDQLEREFTAQLRSVKANAIELLGLGGSAARRIRAQGRRQLAALNAREATSITQLERTGDAAHAQLATHEALPRRQAQGYAREAASQLREAREGSLAQADAAHAQEHAALAGSATRMSETLDAHRGRVVAQLDGGLTELSAGLGEASQGLQAQLATDRATALTLYTAATVQATGGAWGAIAQQLAGWRAKADDFDATVSARADEQVAKHASLAAALPARLEGVSKDVVRERHRSWLSKKLSGLWSAFGKFVKGLIIAVVLIGVAVAIGVALGVSVTVALAAAVVALAASAFVMALWHRGSELADAWGDWPWYKKVGGVGRLFMAAAGDVVGITGIVEGVFEEDFVTGRALSPEEASERFWIGAFSIVTLGLIHWFAKPGGAPAGEKPPLELGPGEKPPLELAPGEKPPVLELGPGEKPPVEPTTEKPPVEPTTEKPPVEPTTEKPPVEPTTEKPPVEPTTEKPPVEPTTEKPPVEPTTEKPPVDQVALEARLGKSALDNLAKELPLERVAELEQRLGAESLKSLSRDLGGREIAALEQQLGAEALQRLSRDLPGRMINDLAAEFQTAARVERVAELAKDPAHGNKITPKTIQEARVGLALEDQGILKPPIKRYPGEAAEFLDGDGQAWDVKGFFSGKGRGAFKLVDDIAKVGKELKLGENVIIDTTKMNAADIASLRAEVTSRGWDPRVKWYP